MIVDNDTLKDISEETKTDNTRNLSEYLGQSPGNILRGLDVIFTGYSCLIRRSVSSSNIIFAFVYLNGYIRNFIKEKYDLLQVVGLIKIHHYL